MASIDAITFDCGRAATLARFWAEVLDGYAVRPYDPEEVARLASLGLTPETDPTVMVDGPGPTLCFQEVGEGKQVKNRVHLDLRCEDAAGEIGRLIALGATRIAALESHTVLHDPEGNEFCVSAAW